MNDPLYNRAVEIVRETQRATASTLQRRLLIGYNRASHLLEQMERDGIVSTVDPMTGRREVAAS